jgi:C-methyltransferase
MLASAFQAFVQRKCRNGHAPSLTIGWSDSPMTNEVTSNVNDKSAARLLELIKMRLISEAIYVAASLGIPDLPAAGPRGSEELAQTTGASPSHLHRILRALSNFDVFSEDSASHFALTATGQHLRRDTDGSLHSAAMLFGGEDGARMLELFLQCVQTGESASQIRFGDWTHWIQSDAELLGHFNAMMTAFSKIHLSGVFDAYDFSIGSEFVDIGGGHGRTITEILRRNPQMHGVLFDLPHALEGGRNTIAQAGWTERCEVAFIDLPVSQT